MRLLREIRRRLAEEDGITVIELVSASLLSMLVMSAIFMALTTTSNADLYTDNDSRTLAAIRQATQRFTRELRESGKVFQDSGPRKIRFWVDDDRDGRQDDFERVTWAIGPTADGTIAFTRKTDAAPTPVVWVENLIEEDAFIFNRTPPETTLVTITLKADASEGHSPPRLVRTHVRLRNAPI